MTPDFWSDVDTLIQRHSVVIDRAANSAHPASPKYTYPLDYGYLEGTRSDDGEGVDVFVGTLPARRVVGVVCTVDGLKSEVEVKLLLGCSPDEIKSVHDFFSQLQMGCGVWLRDPSPTPFRLDSRDRHD
jgi:inorganic pyrophosphatase